MTLYQILTNFIHILSYRTAQSTHCAVHQGWILASGLDIASKYLLTEAPKHLFSSLVICLDIIQWMISRVSFATQCTWSGKFLQRTPKTFAIGFGEIFGQSNCVLYEAFHLKMEQNSHSTAIHLPTYVERHNK